MSRESYIVAVYLNRKKKMFSVTSRMVKSRLSAVDQQMSDMGFTKEVLSSGKGKDNSDRIKKAAKEEWRKRGFSYYTRPAI